MSTRVKIRGIYSTALTKLILDGGYFVVQPSTKMAERFGLELNDHPYDLLVEDRGDLQGIEVKGEPERLSLLLTYFQERLLDAILLELQETEEEDGHMQAVVEFPAASKDTLDGIRDLVVPTVKRHHRLRTIDANTLEKAEMHLLRHPADKPGIEEKLFLNLIFLPLEKSGTVKMEHVRPSGKHMRPREGMLLQATDNRVTFKRTFSKGRYDGLNVPIQNGDYCITEIEEGKWFVKHSYFRRSGNPIGEYYNINSPVELYPYGARYLDLEVDVIHRAAEAPFIIDREKLALLTHNGCISAALEEKALEVAKELMENIPA